MRILAPAVMGLMACSFQAEAVELLGGWQVSAPTGSATFEFLDAPNSKIAGTYRYSPPDCQGDLVQLSVQPPTYMFRERPSNSRTCGTGSIVRVSMTSTTAIRVERIHPTSGKIQSTWDIAKEPGESATALGDFVGQWKGTVQQSGVRPYAIDLSLKSMQVGAVVGDVKYPDYRCVGTWTFESQQTTEAIFVEKIASGPCISGIRVKMKVVQGTTAHLSWIGRQTQADVVKDRDTSLQTTASRTDRDCVDHGDIGASNPHAREVARVVKEGESCGEFSVDRRGHVSFAAKPLGVLDVSYPDPERALWLSKPSPLHALQYAVLWHDGVRAAYVVNPGAKLVVVQDLTKSMRDVEVGSIIRWSPKEDYAVIPDIGEVQQGVVRLDLRTGRAVHLSIGSLERDACDLQQIDFSKGRWLSEARFRFEVQLAANPWSERPCPSSRSFPALPVTVDLRSLSVE